MFRMCCQRRIAAGPSRSGRCSYTPGKLPKLTLHSAADQSRGTPFEERQHIANTG
jgi:hypothetical protein